MMSDREVANGLWVIESSNYPKMQKQFSMPLLKNIQKKIAKFII